MIINPFFFAFLLAISIYFILQIFLQLIGKIKLFWVRKEVVK